MSIAMRAIALLALFAAALVVADKPIDLPCVTWEPLNSNENTDPTDLFLAAYTWVITVDDQCYEEGDIFPCFASDPGVNSWGHHDYQPEDIPSDYCRTYYQGSVYLSNNMYVPKKGPKWQTWKWVLTQSGGTVPPNAIRYGASVMARSTRNAPNWCCGKGFVGWAVGQTNGTFGPVYFSITTDPVITDTFEVAVCEAYHPTTTPAPTTTTTPAPTTTTTTPAPTPAPTTSAPTLPPNNKPYIRFGHTIPTNNNVFATISQSTETGNISYTWSNYKFGEFSSWVEIFVIGTGTIEIYEATASGQKGALLLSTVIPLTPGPLVVVVKDYWPPKHSYNVETIAASYVPVTSGSGVRLFNLSPDTRSMGMKVNGTVVVDNVLYTLGSDWAPIPAAETQTFSIFSDSNPNTMLTSDSFAPPEAPFVFTNFVIGLSNESSASAYALRAVPLVDAPES